MTKEELKQYRFLKKEIVFLSEEIERLRASLTAIPQRDGMPKSNFPADRTSTVISKIVDLEAQLHENMIKLIDLRGRIEQSIEGLPAEQRLVLRLRYIEGRRWEVIAVEMNYAWAQVHRLHGRALREIIKQDTK